MAQIPEIIKVSFDPRFTLNLSNPVFASLWGCIKVGHITDQYFIDHVESVVDEIEKSNPSSYKEFEKIINHSGLSKFGTKEKKESTNMGAVMELDSTFWKGVWSYISGSKRLPYEYEGELIWG